MDRPRFWHRLAVGSLLALIVLALAWELWLAPLHPHGSRLALKALPLMLPLAGLLKRRVYTFQWASMMILPYFAEGIVRATTDRGPSVPYAWMEAALAVVFFVACVAYAAPHKRAARARRAALTEHS